MKLSTLAISEYVQVVVEWQGQVNLACALGVRKVGELQQDRGRGNDQWRPLAPS
jgi:hypothetical protein